MKLNENQKNSIYLIIIVLAVIYMLVGCKKVNDGTPRKIVVTWNDTCNYKMRYQDTVKCNLPGQTFIQYPASGQIFKLNVFPDSCKRVWRSFNVTVTNDGKVVYNQNLTTHEINFKIK